MSWDWHNPTMGAPNPTLGWSHRTGHASLPDRVFEEFLQQQGSRQTSSTPAAPRQPPNPVVNPPRRSGQQRQPVTQPDNVYGDEAPIDILRNYDTFVLAIDKQAIYKQRVNNYVTYLILAPFHHG